ncbi:hypothetical protein PGT21_006437 [Puccinia graminis f. sp. tritici]|uniref:Uncharacterized protein n=1 Tax=Puccinia graminis f. sp. tritici TaxID=56615 RepID=A0A5B0P745_PUCGR|nr:hypothetical protein PGT21_006437 [Puccinia graminis f. sp. tritici]KAA1134213.1 hypothetical protein PGTUg99_032717 [Puccinia graminis f. sp. tritici]
MILKKEETESKIDISKKESRVGCRFGRHFRAQGIDIRQAPSMHASSSSARRIAPVAADREKSDHMDGMCDRRLEGIGDYQSSCSRLFRRVVHGIGGGRVSDPVPMKRVLTNVIKKRLHLAIFL